MTGVPVDEGSIHDSLSIQLGSRARRWIRNTRLPELPAERMRAAERNCHRMYPGRVATRSLSASYNCFGMVFACRRTAICGPEELEIIFEDDGYRQVHNRADVTVGDVVVYRPSPSREISHVGLVIEVKALLAEADVRIKVLSQWGRDGEYIHDEADVPTVYGQYREYYTERRAF